MAEDREMMLKLEEAVRAQILPFRGVDSGYAVRKREELTFTIRPSFPSVFL